MTIVSYFRPRCLAALVLPLFLELLPFVALQGLVWLVLLLSQLDGQ